MSIGSSARPMRSASRQNASIRSFSARQNVEQGVRLGVVGGDRVEHATHQCVVVVRHGFARPPRRPGRPREPAISARTATNSRSASARMCSGVSVAERIVWRILRGEEVRAQARLPLAARQDDIAEMRLEGRKGLGGGGGSGGEPGSQGHHGGSSTASAAARASAMSSAIPGSCSIAFSVWKRPTGRPSSVPTSAALAPASTAGSPSSRPATLVSRSARGANSREIRLKNPSPRR